MVNLYFNLLTSNDFDLYICCPLSDLQKVLAVGHCLLQSYKQIKFDELYGYNGYIA